MTPEEELEHLRFVNANLEARIAQLRRRLDIALMGEHVMRGLWERGVRPGWRCWRIKRRWIAREEATRDRAN